MMRFRREQHNLCTLVVCIGIYTSLFLHCDGTPMQYTAIFHGCKNDNFQMKKDLIIFLFLLKT